MNKIVIKNPFAGMQMVTVIILCCVCMLFFMALGCGKQNSDDSNTKVSLKETKWKLAGIVDTETGILKVFEPKDCEECYTLAFDSDTTATALSIWAIYHLDLLHLNLTRHYSCPDNWDARTEVGLGREAIIDGNGNSTYYDDSVEFRKGISLTRTYESTSNELKFYYDNFEFDYVNLVEIEKHNYLLFKPFNTKSQ